MSLLTASNSGNCAGIGIVANFYAVASLEDNVLVDNPKRTASFANSELRRPR